MRAKAGRHAAQQLRGADDERRAGYATAAGVAHAGSGTGPTGAASGSAELLAGGAGTVVSVQRGCDASAGGCQTSGSRGSSGQNVFAEARGETRQARAGRPGHAGFPAAGSGQTPSVGHDGRSGDLLRSACGHDAASRGGIGARLEHGAFGLRPVSAWVLHAGGPIRAIQKQPDGFRRDVRADRFHLWAAVRLDQRGNAGDAVGAIAADHVRRLPAGSQAAPGTLCRRMLEPLHATRLAVVAGRRRKPGMARPYLAHIPDPARFADAGFPRRIGVRVTRVLSRRFLLSFTINCLQNFRDKSLVTGEE